MSATDERDANHFAAGLVRQWVRLYTATVSREIRGARRAEIDSDLWEHLNDAHTNGRSSVATQLEILSRALRGIPSDLVWCSRVRHTMKENRSMRQHRLRTIALLCGTVAVVNFFATNLIADRYVDHPEQQTDIWWVLAVPIGFYLVGAIFFTATFLLIRDHRAARVTQATNNSN